MCALLLRTRQQRQHPDQRHRLGHHHQSGNLLARYTETQNIDEPLAESRSGVTSYYEADGLGSVTSLSSSTGSLANTYTYDSFGKLTASTGSVTNRFQYTAREFDPETGLYYYLARYYDLQVGRFLSEGPLRFDAGVNFFSYASNNPSNLTDPLGMLQLCCRPARSATWIGLHGCHCFLKLSDGTALGGYFKLFSRDTTWGLLEKKQDFNDDKNPTDLPDCKDLPGSECAVRRAFASLHRFEPYGLAGTSNSIPAMTLLIAGVPHTFPDCAWGANPLNLQPWNRAPVPISSIPKVKF